MLLIFALVFQSAFATVNCRDMLLTQVDFGEIQLREPLRRDLSERQRDSEELDLEAQSLRWAAAEVESDARQLQARLTRLEILVLARLDCPLTPRAARLRRTWATVYDAKKEAKAADESAHQAYERLQRFVLDKLARESERLEALFLRS